MKPENEKKFKKKESRRVSERRFSFESPTFERRTNIMLRPGPLTSSSALVGSNAAQFDYTRRTSMIYLRGVGCHEPRLTNSRRLRNKPDVHSQSDSHEDTHFESILRRDKKYERPRRDGGGEKPKFICAQDPSIKDRFDLENNISQLNSKVSKLKRSRRC